MVPERSDSQSLQDLPATIEEIQAHKLLVNFNCQIGVQGWAVTSLAPETQIGKDNESEP